MKPIHFILIMLLLFTAGPSCNKDKKNDNLTLCDETRNTVLTVTDWHGTVGYNDEIKKWVVNVIIPGTIDGIQTCIICSEVPTNLQQDGLAVAISGELKESNGIPKPAVGGQVFYYISPTKLEKY